MNLVDMMDFSRMDFDKFISLNAKKKIKIESRWDITSFSNVLEIEYGTRIVKKNSDGNQYPVYGGGGETFRTNTFNRENRYVISRFGMSPDCVRYVEGKFFLNDSGFTVSSKDETILKKDFLDIYLKSFNDNIYLCGRGVAQKNIDIEEFRKLQIPLPPKDIQEKIINEIETLEVFEKDSQDKIKEYTQYINLMIDGLETNKKVFISEISENLDNKRKPVTAGNRTNGIYPYYGASGIVDYVDDYLLDDIVLLISEDGANLKSRVTPIAFTASGRIWVNNHAHILKFDNIYTHKLVELYLNRMDLSSYITGQAQPKLNQKNLNQIQIPLPSLEEQKDIVKQIEEIEDKIQNMEKELETLPIKKEEILKKYL